MNLDWAGKMNRFAIRVKLTPTARELWAWLKEEIDEGRTEIVDLRDFQKLVVKERGKPHDFRVIQKAVERLIEAGILRNCRKFTNFVHKWTLRPINRLLYPVISKPKISQSRSQIPNLQPSNDSNSTQGGQAAAAEILLRKLPEQLTGNLEQNLELCAKAGINFEPKDAGKILGTCDSDDVKEAIALFQRRGGHHKIKNPEGFIRWALEKAPWFSFKPSFAEALLGLAEFLGVNHE
ncbi:MAG TPA: hypothetical protein V6C85_26670 [Allocoleopsis sp.]